MSAENLAELKRFARKKKFTNADIERIDELGQSRPTFQAALDILRKIEGPAASHAIHRLAAFLPVKEGIELFKGRNDKHAARGVSFLAQGSKRGADQILALEILKEMKSEGVIEGITGIAGRAAKNDDVPVYALDILEKIATPESSKAIATISGEHSHIRNRALEILEKRSSGEERDRAILDVLYHTQKGMKTPVALLDAFTRVSAHTVAQLDIKKRLQEAADKIIDLPVMIEAAQKDPERLQDVMNRASDVHPEVVSKKAVMATRQAIALAKSYAELLLEKK